MTKQRDILAIRQMIDHAEEALALVKGQTRTDFEQERVLQLALVRLVEIIGEAATRVPTTIREQSDEIPGLMIIGMRNRLIHGYDSIDLDIFWQTLKQDLPSLLPQLKSLLTVVTKSIT